MSSRPSRGAARLAAILDALPDGLVLVNCNGTVVNANTIALELFEAPGTALVGRGLLDLLPTFDSRLIPGSMRRPEATDERGRTKPTRMVARRTDGNEFPVEVTSAGLEDGRDAYASRQGYTGDELLMLVVRDLSGTLDTEAELARSQRQTEMILRAAAEGVVGTDTEGRVVLVNPAAAQILGFRASDLGGQELHPLILHSREDGKPFPYAESPLADTLRSGRKHRVRGQVLWAKDGSRVPVDLTTAPVRDGDQLVGAVMTFTDRRPAEALAERHAAELAGTTERLTAELTATTERFTTELAENEERFTAELADKSERYTTEIERRDERYEELAARHGQLTAVLDGSLRGPLLELRRELGTLADDPAGQLWPEANQILHHLAAGYARMTTLIDNVLGFQRLDTGGERLDKTKVMLDAVVAAGVEGAIELIGPGRVQFAVHAPAIEAEVDTVRLATALAHLAADVAGVDSTGKTRLLPDGGYADSTVVIAAAQRGDVVRIEVRGPFSGGDPVHEPIVRGIVTAHGGVLQTHEMPGMSGSAYVLEVPLGDGAGGIAQEPPAVGGAGSGAPDGTGAPGPSNALPAAPETMPELLPESLAETGEPVEPAGSADDAGLPALPRGAGTAPLDAADRPGDPMDPMEAVEAAGSGRRRGRRSSTDAFLESPVSAEGSASGEDASQPTGRRRAAAPAAPATGPAEPPHAPLPGQGSVPPRTAVPGDGTAAADDTPHDGGEPDGPAAAAATAPGGTGRRRGRPSPAEGDAVPAPESARPGAEGQPVPAGVDDRPGPAVPQGAEGTADNADNANDTDDTATAAEGAAPRSAPGQPVPPQAPEPGRPVPPGGVPPQTARSVAVPPRGTPPQQGGGVSLPQQSTGAPQDRAPRPVPPQGMPPQPVPPHGAVPQHGPVPPQGLPHGLPQGLSPHGAVPELSAAVPGGLGGPGGPAGPQGGAADARPAGRRARRALAPSPVSPDQPDHSDHSDQAGAPAAGPDGPRPAFALPPAEADRVGRVPGGAGSDPHDRHDPVRVAPGADHTPPEHHPLPTGRRRARPAGPQDDTDGTGSVAVPAAAPDGNAPARPAAPGATGTDTGSVSLPLPDLEAPHPGAAPPALRQPLPAEAPRLPRQGTGGRPEPLPADASQGRAFSVRTLGQGVQPAQQQPQQSAGTPRAAGGAQPLPPLPAQRPGPAAEQPAGQGSGRRRKLAAPPGEESDSPADTGAQPQVPALTGPRTPSAAKAPQTRQAPLKPQSPHAPSAPQPQAPGSRLPLDRAEGRAYAIGAPDEGAEGPEPLDGPGGAVEVTNRPQPQPVDDELPPEPLDNPRRLLVWPAPDVSTQQALSDRGYRPVVVHSREEVDAQIAAFPAALFVDPLTGPITRTALQSLRQAAVAAEVPVLVTAGLGQATREAAYGADPAVLLKALAPRDSEQHPSRVLLIEEHEEIALALTEALERRGMQVARAGADTDAVALAAQTRPNLVVMDLMQVRRRRAGIIDWLRANGQLNRTPLVVYTSAGLNRAELPRLSSGETVLFLAERSTSAEVQSRIVDLLAKIGTN